MDNQSARRPRRRPGRPRAAARDLRQHILDVTERLLAERRFNELAVADILHAGLVSRASFYFYFESKHAVLAELVRRAVSAGLEAARPWVEHSADDSPEASLRRGTEAGARLWQERAPVLRAMVENWRTDETLSESWIELMDRFTQVTVERIEQDRASGVAPQSTLEPRVLASALTWLGERVYYLAALGIAPFDNEQHVIDALTHIYALTIYGHPPAQHAVSTR